MKVMLLAAGEGRRLLPLTQSLPKPMLMVGGKTLIDRWIDRFVDAGYREFVINTWHCGDMLMTALGDGSDRRIDIQYSPEPELLETGGGVKHALPLLGKEFIVVSADTACDFDLENLPVSLGQGEAHLVMVDNPSHHPKGDFSLDENGNLGLNTKCLTYAGIGLYSAALFNDSPSGPFKLRLVMDRAIETGRLTGQHFRGFWQDVGTIERYHAVNRHFEK
jgi:MurNAc alpha-1-phosphate uridylyltransferase|tara:strand:+ start:161 stop:820 length:660 start_codon:yes stop_codon:yes gene_type:complete